MSAQKEAVENNPANIISSKVLIRNQKRLTIIHNGEEYILRVTRNGKLILNK